MFEYLKPLCVSEEGHIKIDAFLMRIVPQEGDNVAVLVTAQGDNLPPCLQEPLMVRGPWDEVDIQIPLTLMEYSEVVSEFVTSMNSLKENMEAELDKEKAKAEKKPPAKKAPGKKATPKPKKEKLETISHTLEAKPKETSPAPEPTPPAPAEDDSFGL
jgi:hypothetical protein